MTSREAIRWTFDAVTEIPARVMGLEGYGLEVGKFADMLVSQAADPIEAVRLRATRLVVIRRGRVVARTPPTVAELKIPGPTEDDRPRVLRPASVTAWLDSMTPGHDSETSGLSAIGSNSVAGAPHITVLGLKQTSMRSDAPGRPAKTR
jgi:hypothetical protein